MRVSRLHRLGTTACCSPQLSCAKTSRRRKRGDLPPTLLCPGCMGAGSGGRCRQRHGLDVLSLRPSDVAMSMVPTGQTAALLLVPSPVKQEQGVVGKTRVLVHCLHRASRCSLLVLIVNDERSKDVKSLQADMMTPQV